jgi:hypothetical protein
VGGVKKRGVRMGEGVGVGVGGGRGVAETHE